jgi:hypothetical protein
VSEEVRALRWFTGPGWRVTVGFVGLFGEDADGKWFQVLVGIGTGADEQQDAGMIADYGSRVDDEGLARYLAMSMAHGRQYRY